MSRPQLILASASPRRCELLAQIGISFNRQVADIDETPAAGESAEAFVRRMALEKARAVQLAGRHELPVLGADTVVVIDGAPLGKPQDSMHARQMLRQLSGRMHEVLSAVALVATAEAVALNRSKVWFRELGETEIDAYWETGEPRDKAGSYAIQGLAAIFVERLEGSHSGVMGLPLYETARLLQDFGIQVLGQHK
jgi:septum formation protein